MILITSCIASIYLLLIGSFYRGLQKSTDFVVAKKSFYNSYSILIALRNEESNLKVLFKSLEKINYPKNKYEIIFINDHSEDSSFQLLEKFKQENLDTQIQLLNNESLGKKSAVTTGVKYANFNWILTTDADCTVPSNWIQAYDTVLQKKSYKYISGPVALISESSFLNQFQNIEFLSLQGSTIGSFSIGIPFMCNGANSCFHRSVFIINNGYQGNENIASGDDVFLLEKIISEDANKVTFINSRDAIVYTQQETSWNNLINQKIRWAAKATSYKNKTGIFVGTVIFVSNFLLLILLIFNWKLALLFFLAKLVIDLVFIQKTSQFFKKKISLLPYLLSSILYPIFSVWVFILSQFTTFEWKGRTLKR
ncbi:glycosyltransferase [Flavicella sp.]|uniref:glycosyltransferase n=1 Tax=Flavicella sp. TaxID=2957742 RepID=UPI00301A150E